MGGLASGRPAFWRRARRRLGVMLAAAALGALGMSLVLPAAVASARELAVTASPAPTPARSESPNLRQLLPQLVRPMLSASTPTMKTVAASYACDFSGYGTAITPVTMTANFVYPSSWPVNQPMPLAFAVNSVTLPSQVSSALTGVTPMGISATVTTRNATQKSILLSGSTTATLPSPPTMIPQTEVAGEATFAAKGTGEVDLPMSTIFVVPLVGSTTQSAIECTTQTAAQPQSITVGAASGPFYNCVATVGSGGPGNTETTSGITDMTLTESGTRQVGKSVSVKLSSDDVAANIVALAQIIQQAGSQVSKVTFTAALAVTGAQSGTRPRRSLTRPTRRSARRKRSSSARRGPPTWTSPRRGALTSS